MMKDQESENLGELFRRFLDARAAEAAEEDIRASERFLAAWPAPVPRRCTLDEIKVRMVAAARRRRRIVRLSRGCLATAAAIIVVALVSLRGRGPADHPSATYASIIPTAIWESDNIEAADLDIAYFASEIRRIESEMRDLETGETEIRGKMALDELEIELMALQMEFWKG